MDRLMTPRKDTYTGQPDNSYNLISVGNAIVAFGDPLEYVGRLQKIRERKKLNDQKRAKRKKDGKK